MHDLRRFEKNLRYLLLATRGGHMRARIMAALLDAPKNPHALCKMLGVDYKTAVHHLDVLKKNHWVTKGPQSAYGAAYAPTFTAEERAVFERTWSKLSGSAELGKSIKSGSGAK